MRMGELPAQRIDDVGGVDVESLPCVSTIAASWSLTAAIDGAITEVFI